MPGRVIRTFLDTGVLITAYNGQPDPQTLALNILKDPHRTFLNSPCIRHEVCLKATLNKRQLEYRFNAW